MTIKNCFGTSTTSDSGVGRISNSTGMALVVSNTGSGTGGTRVFIVADFSGTSKHTGSSTSTTSNINSGSGSRLQQYSSTGNE